jgi:hypothetical protein
MTRARGPEEGRSGERWLVDAGTPAGRALRLAFAEAAQAARSSPADGLQRERVWAGVEAPWNGRAPGRGRAWAPLAAGLAVAAASIALVAGPRIRPPVDHDRASLAVRRPEIVPLPAVPPALTSDGATVRHRLPGGVDADLAPHSAVSVGGDETPEVMRGRVRFTVPHQPPGQHYAVRVGAYRVVVLGTIFDVSVEEGGIGVAVERGVVAVESSGGERLRRLERGERWETHPLAAPAEPGATRAVVRPRAPTPPADGGAAILAEAREARRSGDPRRALALYERLARAGGALAESALYEVGAIEDEDLRDPRQALAAWERYRARFPGGLLRAEADLSIVGALSRVGERSRALDEARAFLRRHPTSERRGEVARVAGDLARIGGDCRAAIDLYELAARGPLAAPDADDAAFQRAACLATSGDARAREALRGYLEHFPAGRHAPEASRRLAAPEQR